MKTVHEKFLKPYNPAENEAEIYKLWEESGFFNPDNLPGERTEPFTIIMPPPNANGSLHAGHAVFVTIEDLITRYQRMQGKKALWLPGADHAGFETQVVYEKKLEKEGRTRFGMDPEKLRNEILEFTLANKSFMEGQLKQLGASCDWSREKFTLDPDVVQTVYDTFEQLYKDGLVYRGKKNINWCTKHQTSLSELETISEERVDPLYYMKYGPFTLATVRPETKFGDTAVAVNPRDERYKEWIGKEIEFEGLLGPVKLTVIGDEYVDPAFGTGVVKITPAHDPNDFEVAMRHNLPIVEVIDQFGKLNEKCGKYAGLKVEEARKIIAQDLEKAGLLEKVDAEYKHAVKKCYKCERVLEPRVLPQWFIKMQPLAEKVIDTIERDEVVFYPEHYKKIMLHWLTNIEDWNVSRQIVWGIPIPAWYQTHTGTELEAIHLKKDELCRKLKIQDEKVDAYFEALLERSDFKNKNIQWTTSEDVVQLYVGLIGLLKKEGRVDDAWIEEHRIPRDRVPSKIHIGATPPETIGWIQDSDTFDTWFSSGQWPFATLGYPENPDFKTFYPTQVMETAGEIIFFWVARMLMLGLYRTGTLPFSTVYLHGIVTAKDGKKMSKSKGNVISPLELSEKYGTDALRMGLTIGNTPGTTTALYEDKIKAYKLFANKLWNVTRFILENTQDLPADAVITAQDQKLLEEMQTLVSEVTSDIENYRFYIAGEKLYQYVWHRLADQILEESKALLKGDDQKQRHSRGQVLRTILMTLLKLLHPFMPFVTEAIWQLLPSKDSDILMVAKWPSA